MDPIYIRQREREKKRQYIEIYMSRKKEEKRERKKIEKNKHVSEKNENAKSTFTRAGIKPERKSKKKQPKYKKPFFSSLSFPFFT